jgi:hypothetical protein
MGVCAVLAYINNSKYGTVSDGSPPAPNIMRLGDEQG